MTKSVIYLYGFLFSLYVFYLMIIGQLTMDMLVIVIFLLIPIISLQRMYRKKSAAQRELNEKLATITAKEKSLQKEINEKKQIIHDLDLIHLAYDVTNKTIHVSSRIESIFECTKEEFERNPFKWQDVIHQEDMKLALNKEKQLLFGTSITYTHRIELENQKVKWVENKAVPFNDSNGKLVSVYRTFLDITEQKMREDQLRQLAFYDDLTELPNRKLLDIQLKKALARSKRHDHTLVTMFIDLDGFKKVNDTYGHESGDLLLKEVANRLNESVREEDLIVRLGGDEFVIVCEEADKEEASDIAERIITTVSKPFLIKDQEVTVSPSIGISVYPEDGENRETLIENADKAMYHAKRKGKNNYQFYTEDLSDVQSRKFDIFEKIFKSVSKMRN
ncbi:sensor domain-containing diguanylate cyclase [Halalkalibacter alkaliphilus]|uniref:Sensor domain-containing diguanylate cyclase n=1 Tax=Halalkalibacter alkaliphilus TaxID=2917993 RepID=A0A9X2CQQ2_9BACI|nr:sensor domain-containing diguanylate cyclase [Halalkalibacter alkaliphilus]MCL7746036.1 sensor domain-containing diguanylate cyclase [Halalkalibacter alkaliphilus]